MRTSKDRRARAKGRKTSRAEGHHAQIPVDVMTSHAFVEMPDWATRVLVALAGCYRGTNNGDLWLARSAAKLHGIHPWKLTAGLALLEYAGLIERTRISSFANGKGSCGLYALAWRDIDPSEKYDSPCVVPKPAEHRYANWQRPSDWTAIVTRYKRRAQGKTNADHQEWLKQVGGLPVEAVQKAA